jgi:hypothetical protein
VFATGRGKCVALDLFNPSLIFLNGCLQSLTVGGQNVLDGLPAGLFKFNALPGTRLKIVGEFGENQTYQVLTGNGSVAAFVNSFLQYYENEYATESNYKLLSSKFLATKQLSFNAAAAAGANTSTNFVVPKNRGRIFAVQFFADDATGANPVGLYNADITVRVNGVEILETVPALLFSKESTRQNFFLIDIEPGSTLQVVVNNAAGAAIIQFSVNLFFVPQSNC